MTNTDAIARAAAEISATEVGPGIWAHYDDATQLWYTVTSEDLARLVGYLEDADPSISNDAYSHWCAGTTATEMPVGWSPSDAYPLSPGVRHCECGEWSGERCEWSGHASQMLEVEFMPPQHRASHGAASNRGTWPHNGARRIFVSPACARLMTQTDGEWCEVVP